LVEKIREDYEVEINALEKTEVEEISPADLSPERVQFLKEKITGMGVVNAGAFEEYEEVKKRFNFLTTQQNDLLAAKDSLKKIIEKINQESRKIFREVFSQIKANFSSIFEKLFEGGSADLVLVDEKNILESGIEILAKPPGKKLQSLTLLSGGEKALTVIALLFAIFKVRPSPFCLLDEIDATLDDANIYRFTQMLSEFSQKTQFIIITHNKRTMEIADVLYGITMEESGISKVISVKFKQRADSKLVLS
jgi:chromosome segregation protein